MKHQGKNLFCPTAQRFRRFTGRYQALYARIFSRQPTNLTPLLEKRALGMHACKYGIAVQLV